MPLSRRRFLRVAAALPLALHERLAGKASVLFNHSLHAGCVVVDFGEHCALQESLAGFMRGLAAASIHFRRVSAEAIQPADFIVIPGAVLHSSGFAQTLRHLSGLGSTVIYESGAAYSEPEAFETERHLLKRYFGLSVRAPSKLWTAKPGIVRSPYVHYRWPARVMVRDFSRIIPVSDEVTQVAWTGKTAVACRRQFGSGLFVFLGSPLGPHLGLGDPDAQLLLEAFLARQQGTTSTYLSLTNGLGSVQQNLLHRFGALCHACAARSKRRLVLNADHVFVPDGLELINDCLPGDQIVAETDVGMSPRPMGKVGIGSKVHQSLRPLGRIRWAAA